MNMNGWRITILNRWKFFIPKILISFQNEWKSEPWIDRGDGTFNHLCHCIVDNGNWLKDFDKEASNLGYTYSVHLWLLEFGTHIYIG